MPEYQRLWRGCWEIRACDKNLDGDDKRILNMMCVRQGPRKYKYKDKHKDKHKDKYKDKYKNSRQTYDVICFWKGDDNRSLIMKNVVNIQSMQNIQNM